MINDHDDYVDDVHDEDNAFFLVLNNLWQMNGIKGSNHKLELWMGPASQVSSVKSQESMNC